MSEEKPKDRIEVKDGQITLHGRIGLSALNYWIARLGKDFKPPIIMGECATLDGSK